jgi:AAA+ ATPase superfamily predicted ATPase
MINFIGRAKEKKKLHDMLDVAGLQACLIYGRRRVGKSELIKQILRETDMTAIYYECKQTTEQNNVESLAAIISEVWSLPKLSFSGIEETLDYIFKQSMTEPIVLVLDEYSYLRDKAAGLDSIMQVLIDKYKDDANLKLIICGSYIGIMKSLLEKNNPLYGRIDLSINLKPMDYLESALFYPGFSNVDKVRMYSVFGGIPYYNRLVNDKKSVRDNIMFLLTSPGSRLENEVPIYLRSEISKITNANEVFEALAAGYSRFNDILSQSHVSSSPTLADVLDRLIKMEIVIKQAPINDEHNKKKMGYRIIDNLSLYYYRYIYRYLSQRSIMDPEVFYDRFISDDFEAKYVPHIFEDVCRQYLILQNRAGKLPVIFEKIGKYWYDDPVHKKNGEFDIVTEDSEGYIPYEVKFRKDPLSSSMIETEVKQVKESGLRCYKYGFIARSGFEAEPADNMIFITLDDIFK